MAGLSSACTKRSAGGSWLIGRVSGSDTPRRFPTRSHHQTYPRNLVGSGFPWAIVLGIGVDARGKIA